MQKQYRLKKNEEISKVVRNRKRVGNNNYIIYYKEIESEKSMVAISVSKKYGKAFQRNYAKRIVREILRNPVKKIKNLEFVVVVKENAKNTEFLTLKEELVNTIKYIARKVRRENENK